MIKPLWSITIPTYNAAKFIAETLESVLMQDMGQEKMEIIVVDNCSTDDTLDVVREIAKDRVKIIINEKNVGPHGNFNRCVEASNGELIHILHADDLVKPEFYQKFESIFLREPEVYLVCCNAEFIDEKGAVCGMSRTMTTLSSPSSDVSEMMFINHMYTPCVVVRKKAYDKLGGFDVSFTHVGDWDMWVRIIYNFKALYIEDFLAQYRTHATNGTTVNMNSGLGIIDHEKLYLKFLKLQYPVSKVEVHKYLKGFSKSYYKFYYYASNSTAASNVLNLFRRYSNGTEVLLLVNSVKIRKGLSSIKKFLLKRNNR